MKVEITRAAFTSSASRRTLEEFAKQYDLVLVVTARVDGMFTACFHDTTLVILKPDPAPSHTIQEAVERYAAHISSIGLRLPDGSVAAAPHFVVSRIYE